MCIAHAQHVHVHVPLRVPHISTAYPLRELDHHIHQEPLVEGGEAKLEMTPVSVSRER